MTALFTLKWFLLSAPRLQYRTARCFPVAFLALSLLTGCSSATVRKEDATKAESPQCALEVGDRKITPEQLSQAIATRLGEFGDQMETDHIKSRILDDLVAELLLDHAARKAGIVANENDVQMYLQGLEAEKTGIGDAKKSPEWLQEEVRKTLRIQRYIKDFLVKDYQPDAAAVQKYYEEHQAEFLVPESVHVKEILLNSADQAERIMDLLKAGQNRNFSQLATQYSIAPTNTAGGDMGFFAKGDLPEEMEKVFFNMRVPGRVSPIIQTKYGYHIFMLVERTKEHQEPFDKVKERIAGRLAEEHQKQAAADTIAQLRATVPRVLYRRYLDFSYNGQEFAGGFNK